MMELGTMLGSGVTILPWHRDQLFFFLDPAVAILQLLSMAVRDSAHIAHCTVGRHSPSLCFVLSSHLKRLTSMPLSRCPKTSKLFLVSLSQIQHYTVYDSISINYVARNQQYSPSRHGRLGRCIFGVQKRCQQSPTPVIRLAGAPGSRLRWRSSEFIMLSRDRQQLWWLHIRLVTHIACRSRSFSKVGSH